MAPLPAVCENQENGVEEGYDEVAIDEEIGLSGQECNGATEFADRDITERLVNTSADLVPLTDGESASMAASSPEAVGLEQEFLWSSPCQFLPASNESLDTTQAEVPKAMVMLENDLNQPENEMLMSTDSIMSPTQPTQLKTKKKKHVSLRLNPLAYQKLMKLVTEKYSGSLEKFVNAAVKGDGALDKNSNNLSVRRPPLSKWKRCKFDTLKGQEIQELTLAFRALAKSTAGTEITRSLLETPWQDLTMAQIEKMLDETKKMLALTEKVHDCAHPRCNRRFTTPGNLRDHLNEHSGERPYICTCEGCDMCFSSKQLLSRHLKKHECSHECTVEGCNKRFAFRERLIVHQKIHCVERPLTCEWEGCGKTFKWANSLQGHMRTHTGEKPFKCTFAGCGRLFGYKVDLTRHIRTHYGQPARQGNQ